MVTPPCTWFVKHFFLFSLWSNACRGNLERLCAHSIVCDTGEFLPLYILFKFNSMSSLSSRVFPSSISGIFNCANSGLDFSRALSTQVLLEIQRCCGKKKLSIYHKLYLLSSKYICFDSSDCNITSKNAENQTNVKTICQNNLFFYSAVLILCWRWQSDYQNVPYSSSCFHSRLRDCTFIDHFRSCN